MRSKKEELEVAAEGCNTEGGLAEPSQWILDERLYADCSSMSRIMWDILNSIFSPFAHASAHSHLIYTNRP